MISHNVRIRPPPVEEPAAGIRPAVGGPDEAWRRRGVGGVGWPVWEGKFSAMSGCKLSAMSMSFPFLFGGVRKYIATDY